MNITERFLKYVGYGTNSDEKSETCPSPPNQLVLGAAIAEELKALGLTDVEQDADGYVYGYLPGEGEALGLIAHMDTSPAVSGDHIKPRIVTYPGGVLELGASTLSPTDYPFLEEYIGQELIVTDGTTLLGADDKAGVAEIVTLCEYLLAHPEVKHRPIAVCFTPDEEIGRGTDRFRMDRFPAKEAYTVDGGELGEIEYENFNAAAATVKVRGLNIHPGSAKNKMKNAALLLAEFIGLLPAAETLVLLTEVTPQSIEAAAKTADWWAGQGARNLRTVFNRVGRRLPRDLGYPHLDAVLDAIGARLLGMIPEGADLPYSAATGNIAARLCGESRPLLAVYRP